MKEGFPAKNEEIDLLSEVITSLEHKGYEKLVPLLMEINRNKIKKEQLLYAFNMSGANWNYFLDLESSQAEEMVSLLKNFLSEANKKESENKAREITEKLNY